MCGRPSVHRFHFQLCSESVDEWFPSSCLKSDAHSAGLRFARVV